MTAATRVDPEIGRAVTPDVGSACVQGGAAPATAGRAAGRWARRTSEQALLTGLVLLVEELVVVAGEEVAAVLIDEDVVEPLVRSGLGRRVERGGERVLPRRVDGGRRQALGLAQVVGRVEVEVGLGE